MDEARARSLPGQFLARITPTLTAAQKALLVRAYDAATQFLATQGYLTAAQLSTLQAVASGI